MIQSTYTPKKKINKKSKLQNNIQIRSKYCKEIERSYNVVSNSLFDFFFLFLIYWLFPALDKN